MAEPVYKQYDQGALDAQYNLRARHPDVQEHFDWYERESAAAREDFECRLDVAYGDTSLQALDVFPAARAGSPVQVFIHGGYWRSMDKSYFSYPARVFVPAGAAYVSLNYDLAPAVSLDRIVAQCRRALAWCRENAADFNGDPERIHVSGHSAGGHLCVMMMNVDASEESEPGPFTVRGGCSISGLFDLEPVRLCFLNEDLKLDAEAARRNSPLFSIPRLGAPLIAAVGAGETDEFRRQNGMLATAWRARGFPCEELRLPGLHHFDVMEELISPESPLTAAMLAQMGL